MVLPDGMIRGDILVWLSENKTHPAWKPFFRQSFIQDILRNIEKHISKDDFCPHAKNIFKVFKLTPPDKIRAVILGMDPYQSRGTKGEDAGMNRANGIAFSTDLDEIPRSLSNIFREMMSNGYARPPSADLTYLLKEGVFLLNSALTVKYDESGSHNDLWRGFTIELLKWIVARCRTNGYECCFLLWGKKAQKVASEAKIYDSEEHVFSTSHPSPYSANRGFIGCQHFSSVNVYLKNKGLREIKWGWRDPTDVVNDF